MMGDILSAQFMAVAAAACAGTMAATLLVLFLTYRYRLRRRKSRDGFVFVRSFVASEILHLEFAATLVVEQLHRYLRRYIGIQ